MTNADELAHAKKYVELKKSGNNAELGQLATSIVDLISLQSYSFPFKKEALSSDGTTTYVYQNSSSFPELYGGELLHSKVPLEVVRNSCQAK